MLLGQLKSFIVFSSFINLIQTIDMAEPESKKKISRVMTGKS
jgi:hypothetical protein